MIHCSPYHLQEYQMKLFTDEEMNGTRRMRRAKISQYRKPAMMVQCKLIVLVFNIKSRVNYCSF